MTNGEKLDIRHSRTMSKLQNRVAMNVLELMSTELSLNLESLEHMDLLILSVCGELAQADFMLHVLHRAMVSVTFGTTNAGASWEQSLAAYDEAHKTYRAILLKQKPPGVADKEKTP